MTRDRTSLKSFGRISGARSSNIETYCGATTCTPEYNLGYTLEERHSSMTSASITVLLDAWQEHQLTNRELIAESRQLTPEDRTVLRATLQQTIAAQQVAAAVAR